jgi:hypothetical protein
MIKVGVVRERATVLGTFDALCDVAASVDPAGVMTGAEASWAALARDRDNSAISAAVVLRFCLELLALQSSPSTSRTIPIERS